MSFKKLDLNSPTIVADLEQAGIPTGGSRVNIQTPQFERIDGIVVNYFPKTLAEFKLLPLFNEASLLKMGLGIWERTADGVHWLYPREWYSSIPQGLDILTISNKCQSFEPGTTDDDARFGMLAYGFMVLSGEYENETTCQ